MNVSDAQRLKTLKADSPKLKKLLANSMLDARGRRDARGAQENVMAVAARREVVRRLQDKGLSERRALKLLGMSAGGAANPQ